MVLMNFEWYARKWDKPKEPEKMYKEMMDILAGKHDRT
jgi:hypothetical protein